MKNCPCGSGNAYSDCCEPVIKGSRPAETAEQLMRARYSAYAGVEMDFVLRPPIPASVPIMIIREQENGLKMPNGKDWR